MLLLTERVPDSYSGNCDGTSPEARGVFSTFEKMTEAILGKQEGEVRNHKWDAYWKNGEFTIKYKNDPYPSHFTYEEIHLDKLI